MMRRWTKPEMWVPGGYLALVAAMLVRLEVASQAGQGGCRGPTRCVRLPF